MQIFKLIDTFVEGSDNESRIVQLDHESILQFGELNIVKDIAPSFSDFLRPLLEEGDA
jgi:hypothetical protein